MNIQKKIANENHEMAGGMTTRWSRHGITKAMRRIKRAYNRAAKRKERRLAFKDQEQ